MRTKAAKATKWNLRERWGRLIASTYPGERLLLTEAAARLSMTNPRSMRHYVEGDICLPDGFIIVRIGRTVLLERTTL